MPDWVRKTFDSIGVTQSPPGPALPAVQERYFGHVVLCIDVSGSMADRDGRHTRLDQAKRGAERFVAEAMAAHYKVGLILWDHSVAAAVPVCADPKKVLARLAAASAGGGTNVCPALRHAIDELLPLSNDRVIAVFGDGDLGDPGRARALAAEAAENRIRILVRGLARQAAAAMSQLATRDSEPALVPSTNDIEDAIASMAKGLTRRASRE